MVNKQHIFVLYILDDNHMRWISLSPNKEFIEEKDLIATDTFPKTTQQDTLIVFTPGIEVLSLQVKLPKLNQHELKQALPYACEEQCATNIEDLHFSPGKYNDSGLLDTLVMDRQRLNKLLEFLSSKQLTADVILPDYLSLPYQANQWYVQIEQKTARVRTGQCSGFCTELANLPHMLKLKLSYQKNHLPEKIIIADNKKETHLNHHDISTEIPVKFVKKDYKSINTSSPINLLLKKAKHSHKLSGLIQSWKLVAYSVLLYLCIMIAGKTIEYFFILHAKNKIQYNIDTLQNDIFPNYKTKISSTHQLHYILKHSQQNHLNNQFVQSFTNAAIVIKKFPSMTLHSVQFNQGLLTIQLSSKILTDIEHLHNLLPQQNLHVKQHTIQAKDKLFWVKFIIKGNK